MPLGLRWEQLPIVANLWNSLLDSTFAFSGLPFPRQPILFIKFPLLETPGMALLFWSESLTNTVHGYTFSVSCLEISLPMNKKDTSGVFHITYDLRFRLQNSKHTQHVDGFLHSTPIFRNYHSSSLPNAVDGFLKDAICRYKLRNNCLYVLSRARTLRTLNVETPLVRLFRRLAWGWMRLWLSCEKVRDFRGK